jgi:hypothetical protein
MRKFAIVTSLAFALVLPAIAQNRSNAVSTAVKNSIDPAKVADIHRLLEITGAKNLVNQLMVDMTNALSRC